MKTDYTIYRPDGTEENGSIDWPNDPGYKLLNPFLCPIIGVKSACFEHVSVLHNNKPHDMFVDEEGQLKGLPLNVKATAIYRNNAIKRMGERAEDLPTIVGVAILFHRRVWF